MKRLVYVLLSLLLFLIIPHYVQADDTWDIENFQSNLAIQKSGNVQITETISVDFRTTPQHGIYRDIPYEYNSNGNQVYTNITIRRVLQNNSPVQYTTSQTNGYEEIRIGNPNQTVVGRNVYTIIYTVVGVLRNVGNYDELYWNVTGNDWSIPIQKAEATVSLPKEGISKAVCYQGASGSQTQCAANIESSQVANFSTINELGIQDGMTIAVGYKKGLVPLLVVQSPKALWQELFEWPSNAPFVLIVLVGIIVLGIIWYKHGRDYWFAGNLFGTPDQKGNLKPIRVYETVTVEFTPPEKLRPAEIGVLIDERADTLDITATVIDLAARGYLTITEIPKKWMFGPTDYLLTQSTTSLLKKTSDLLAYEQLLLDKLFYKRHQIKLSSLSRGFYESLKEVKQALYDDVVSKKFFSFNPEKTRDTYRIIATLLIAIAVGLFFAGGDNNEILLAILGLIVDSIFIVIIQRYMPHRTAFGHQLYQRAKGYRLFIESAEKYRQRYFEKQNMLNEVLPYAIVFGQTKKFAKKMEKMGIKTKQPAWYIGSQSFAVGAFAGSIQNFSTTFSVPMASVPSSSGGFSAGSSGGGFGGGSGGSW